MRYLGNDLSRIVGAHDSLTVGSVSCPCPCSADCAETRRGLGAIYYCRPHYYSVEWSALAGKGCIIQPCQSSPGGEGHDAN